MGILYLYPRKIDNFISSVMVCEFGHFFVKLVSSTVYLNWSNINLELQHFWHFLKNFARTFGAGVTGNLSQINCYIMALTEVTLSRTSLAIMSSISSPISTTIPVLLANQIEGKILKSFKNWLTSRPQSVLIMYILCENIYFTPSLNLLETVPSSIFTGVA